MPRTVVMSNPLPLGGLELAILGNPGPNGAKASTRRDATMKKSPTKAGRAKRARRRAPVPARAAASPSITRRRYRRRRPHLDIIPISRQPMPKYGGMPTISAADAARQRGS